VGRARSASGVQDGQTVVHPVRSSEQVRRPVVCLIGELDLATAPRLAPTADELRARPVTKLVLDLRQLSFLDAAGVAPLVELAVSLAESGCATVAVGASPQQELILGMTPIALGRDADLDRERDRRQRPERSGGRRRGLTPGPRWRRVSAPAPWRPRS